MEIRIILGLWSAPLAAICPDMRAAREGRRSFHKVSSIHTHESLLNGIIFKKTLSRIGYLIARSAAIGLIDATFFS